MRIQILPLSVSSQKLQGFLAQGVGIAGRDGGAPVGEEQAQTGQEHGEEGERRLREAEQRRQAAQGVEDQGEGEGPPDQRPGDGQDLILPHPLEDQQQDRDRHPRQPGLDLNQKMSVLKAARRPEPGGQPPAAHAGEEKSRAGEREASHEPHPQVEKPLLPASRAEKKAEKADGRIFPPSKRPHGSSLRSGCRTRGGHRSHPIPS
jgi:hypothetical protein